MRPGFWWGALGKGGVVGDGSWGGRETVDQKARTPSAVLLLVVVVVIMEDNG